MKKLISFLLIAVMIFSLAACSSVEEQVQNAAKNEPNGGGAVSPQTEQYDAEFSILVGDNGKWTPFENASGVTFANSGSGIISTSNDGQTVTFSGLADGDSVITATQGANTSIAIIHVNTPSTEGDSGSEIIADPPKPLEWPDDEVGNLVPKPPFDYVVKYYLVGEGRKILFVEFPGASLEQIQSYLSDVKQAVYAKYPEPNTRRTLHWDYTDPVIWGECHSFTNASDNTTDVTLKWYGPEEGFEDTPADLCIEWRLK